MRIILLQAELKVERSLQSRSAECWQIDSAERLWRDRSTSLPILSRIPKGNAGLLACLLGLAAFASAPIEQPFPRAIYTGEVIHRFVTDTQDAGVVPAGTASAQVVDGHLRIDVTGSDPQIILSGFPNAEGPLCLAFRTRLTGGGMGMIYWGDSETPGFSGDRAIEFQTEYDDHWHAHTIPIPIKGQLTHLRLDLGSEKGGRIDITQVVLRRGGKHPLEITRIAQDGANVTATIRNHSATERAIRFRDQAHSIAAGATLDLLHPLDNRSAIQSVDFHIESEGVPAIERRLWVHNPGAEIEAVTLRHEGLRLDVARDGTVARIYAGDELQAVMAPLALVNGDIPDWTAHSDNSTISLQGNAGLDMRFDTDGVLAIRADAALEMETVIRVIGGLEQAVFPGLEYLGKGEHSSSRLDFHTDQHFRYMPKARDLTWPAMMVVTDQQSVALRWDDKGMQPSFASPNFVDGASDHRMTLHGKRIRAKLRLTPPAPVTNSILWAVQDMGLPPLPTRPRSDAEQAALCRRAYEGPLRSPDGWGHCVEENYPRRWYADLASAYWALGGDLATLPDLLPGGGHIRDNRSLFLTNRADMWLQMRRAEVRRVMQAMQADGSFRYNGKYRKGHFEDTASGHCSKQSLTLLNYAQQTGDSAAREAGLKGLAFMRKFSTPRGAQTWELSLHTPDILAAAHLVEAYVIGYELSGEEQYLAEARKWAVAGLPFIYLRGDQPVQRYATIPVFGASSWVAPNWIGKPVQWNGLLYAHAVARLAPLDSSFPWQQVAKGIAIAAEHMQEADGPRVGCLPDYWFIDSARGGGPAINPSVIQFTTDRAWGRPAGLQTIVHNGHQVTGPFPFELKNGKLHATSRPGTHYQVIVDGKRILTVTGTGSDIIE